MFPSIFHFVPLEGSSDFVQVDTTLCVQLYVTGDVDLSLDTVMDLSGLRTIPFLLSMNGSVKTTKFQGRSPRKFWRNYLPSKDFASRLELTFPSLYNIMSRYQD